MAAGLSLSWHSSAASSIVSSPTPTAYDPPNPTTLKQFPTPPGSSSGSPVLNSSSPENINISTTFFPGAEHFQHPPDIALLTDDCVYFYVHFSRLLAISSNKFGSLLASPPRKLASDNTTPVIDIPASSPVLNLVLHAIYDLSCAQYGPDLDLIVQCLDYMPDLGISAKRLVLPNSPLFAVLVAYAPVQPMDIYIIASKYDLRELAAAVSSHLLSFPLATITDDIATRIGPVYLKRLFFLHMGRIEALKRILLEPPQVHGPTPGCDFTDQRAVTRAWSLATAFLAFEVRPDMSVGYIESTLRPLTEHITCPQCLNLLDERIKSLLASWSLIKRTI